jgi:DNA-binding response OmpR family regulator
MLTAIGPNLNEMTAPLYGADDHLDKPFMIDELLERLEKLALRYHKTALAPVA